MYKINSDKAETFISNEEIIATIEFAQKNKNNKAFIKDILNKKKYTKQKSCKFVLNNVI